MAICVILQGRAWDEGGIIVGPEYRIPPSDPFQTPAADASQELQLTVHMPRAVAPGQSVSATVEVVSIKGKTGGSPVELTLDPLVASVTAAGMTHHFFLGFKSCMHHTYHTSGTALPCLTLSHMPYMCLPGNTLIQRRWPACAMLESAT